MPYITAKFSRIEDGDWSRQARVNVEKSLGAGMTLSTMLVGVNADNGGDAWPRFAARSRAKRTGSRFARTLSEIQAIEIDCFIHHAITITREESEQAQQRQAEQLSTAG